MQQRLAIVQGGWVIGIIEAYPEGWTPAQGEAIACGKDPQVGWRHDGVVFSPPPPPVPESEHIAWVEQALIELGKLDQVEALVAGHVPTQRLWKRVTSLGRRDPEVLAIGGQLGIDLDALFVRAAQIRVERRGG